MTAFMYGISSYAASSWAKYILIAGLLLLVLFVRYEIRLEQPILNIRLFTRSASFAFSNLAALINYSATFAVGFLLSLYLQVVAGFDSRQRA